MSITSASSSHITIGLPEAGWERLKIGGGTPPVMCAMAG